MALLKVERDNLTAALEAARKVEKNFRAQFDIGQRGLTDLLGIELQLYNLKLALLAVEVPLRLGSGGKPVPADWRSSDIGYLTEKLTFQRGTVAAYGAYKALTQARVESGAALDGETAFVELELRQMQGDLKLTEALMHQAGGIAPAWDRDAAIAAVRKSWKPAIPPSAAAAGPSAPLDPSKPVLDPNAQVLDPNAPAIEPAIDPAGGTPALDPSAPLDPNAPVLGPSAPATDKASKPDARRPEIAAEKLEDVATAAGEQSMMLKRPGAFETVEIETHPGDVIYFAFAREDVKILAADPDVIFAFNDSAQIILYGLNAQLDAVRLAFKQAAPVPARDFAASFGSIEQLAESLQKIETCGNCANVASDGIYLQMARGPVRGVR
jgi:hypothetical protein